MSSAFVPYIPESAPFSSEQREWLNGFLAGIFSKAPQSASGARTTQHSIAILHASQSGTGEGLSRKLAKELKGFGYAPVIASLETHTPDSIAEMEHAVFIVSTYGDGDPPDAAQSFFKQLKSDAAPRLDKLTYALFALGDRTYEHFCKFGIDLDDRLHALGAHRLLERTNVDADLDQSFASWRAALVPRLETLKATWGPATAPAKKAESAPVAASANVPTLHTRDNPHRAPLLTKQPLTAEGSSKQTLHLAFCLRDTALTYESGDACGLIPQNDPDLVANILASLQLSGTEVIDLPAAGRSPAQQTSIGEALAHTFQITKLTRKLLQGYAARGNCANLLGLLKPDRQGELDQYLYDRGFIDLLDECPGVLSSAADLVALLPRLTPRLYSISSSPTAHAGEVHTTIAVVRYRTLGRERGGVCSTQVADRISPGDRLPLYIQPNKRFRIPQDPSARVVMIGPGTGIAPFRSFLHERRALGHAGANWLFFGERSAATDFLYRDELLAMQADKHLTRLDLAFSRDQPQKVYVQDRMLENAQELYGWLEDGASVYVCGDASRMAKDVDTALHKVIETAGSRSPEDAAAYVSGLKAQHRYHRDVY